MSHIASHWAMEVTGINPSAKLILLILADYHNSTDGRCFPAVSKLSYKSGHDTRTVRKYLVELADAGLIEIKERFAPNGRQQSNQYNLLIKIEPVIFKPEENDPDPLEDDGGGITTPQRGAIRTPLEPVINNHSDTTYRADTRQTDIFEDDPPDGEKLFWDEAVASLMVMGLEQKYARVMVGKVLKLAKKDYRAVAAVIDTALQKGVADPIPYIMAAFSNKKAQKKQQIANAFAELEAEHWRKVTEAELASNGTSGGEEDLLWVQSVQHDGPGNVPETGGKGSGWRPGRDFEDAGGSPKRGVVKSKISADDSGIDF